MNTEEELISRYLDQKISTEEVTKLEKSLYSKPELRRKFYEQINAISALEDEFSTKLADEKIVTLLPRESNTKYFALAASFVVGMGLLAYSFLQPEPVATLLSNENAAWESSLPTSVGSRLAPGIMNLKSGVATIRFSSGAEVTLEAPAQIELNHEMEGKLNRGNAIIHVPESAHGFVLVTPSGYAIDHGTSFGVSINEDKAITDFTVLDGEISVHSQNGDSIFLNQNESVTLNPIGMSEKSITQNEEPLAVIRGGEKVVRLQSNSKSQSIIRNNHYKYLSRDFLMVKLDQGNKQYERRALLNFTNTELKWAKAKKVKLRLNLVPSGLGNRVYLPKTSRFKVYALAGQSEMEWGSHLAWQDVPSLKSFHFIGDFNIPRSQERGPIVIENIELLQFLQKNNANEYTFLILLETPEVQGGGMVHAFASDFHPEASGPSIEVYF